MIHMKDFDVCNIENVLKHYDNDCVLVCKCKGNVIFTISDPNLMVFYPKFIVTFSHIYKCAKMDDFELYMAVPDEPECSLSLDRCFM